MIDFACLKTRAYDYSYHESRFAYAKRYQIFCEKAFREGLYDATAFLMSNKAGGLKGAFIEPSPELSFKKLAAAIHGRAVAHCKQRVS